jgi:hypothetical protein
MQRAEEIGTLARNACISCRWGTLYPPWNKQTVPHYSSTLLFVLGKTRFHLRIKVCDALSYLLQFGMDLCFMKIAN